MRKALLILAVVGLVWPAAVLAASSAWTGAVDPNAHDPNNWAAGVPSDPNDAVLDGTASGFTVDLYGAAIDPNHTTVSGASYLLQSTGGTNVGWGSGNGTFTIGAGGAVTLDNVRLQGNLDLSGNLTLANNGNLALGSGGSASSAGGNTITFDIVHPAPIDPNEPDVFPALPSGQINADLALTGGTTTLTSTWDAAGYTNYTAANRSVALNAPLTGTGNLRIDDVPTFVINSSAAGTNLAGELQMSSGSRLSLYGSDFDFTKIVMEDAAPRINLHYTTLDEEVTFGSEITIASYNEDSYSDITGATLTATDPNYTVYVRGSDGLKSAPDLRTAGTSLTYNIEGDINPTYDGDRVHVTPQQMTLLGSDTDGAGGVVESGDLLVSVTTPLLGTPYGTQDIYLQAQDPNHIFDGTVTFQRGDAGNQTANVHLADPNVVGYGHLVIDDGAVLFVDSLEAATQTGSLTVKDGGFLSLGDTGQPVFAGGKTLEPGAGVLLTADIDYTLAGDESVLIESVQFYGENGQLTVNSNTGGIGTAGRDLYGFGRIISPIIGSATVINFRGSGPNLYYDDMRIGEIGGVAVLTGGRSVNIERNMQFDVDNTYTGGTDISAGYRLRVNSDQAAGTGDITFSGTSSQPARLEIGSDGFTLGSGKIVLSEYGEVELWSDMAANVEFAGGSMSALRWNATGIVGTQRTLSGGLTDAGDVTFTEGTMDFTQGITLTGNRMWTVDADAAASFGGAIDGGGNTLAIDGGGTIRMDDGVSNVDATVDGSTLIRGSASTISGSTVALANGGVYGVEKADHTYGEVSQAGSNGVIALGGDLTSGTLSQADGAGNVRIGALDEATIASTASVEPGVIDASTASYAFGGGGGRLTVDAPLADFGGRTTGVLITNNGETVLGGNNTFTGDVTIDAMAGISAASALPAGVSVDVNTGGALDLKNTGLAVTDARINWNGGGVSNSGGSLSAADLTHVFGSGNYVLGGAGPESDETLIAAGGLASGSVTKVGTNSVRLASGANAFSGDINVEAGQLIVDDAASVANYGSVYLNGGVMRMNDSASWTYPQLVFGKGGKLEVAAGETIEYRSYLVAGDFQGNTGELIIGGGGTIDSAYSISANNHYYASARTGQSRFTITDTATLRTNWTSGVVDKQFYVEDGATLELVPTSNDSVAAGIGHFYPGSKLIIQKKDDEVTTVNSTVSDNTSIHFDGSGASWAKPYEINVVDGAKLVTMTNQTTGIIQSSLEAGFPTAYIKKTGLGVWDQQRSNESFFEPLPRKFAWEIAEGKINADANPTGSSALGGTVDYVDELLFYQSHLEAMIVRSGAALDWSGTHGFFSSSIWADIAPEQDGDGWNPDEFILEDNTTLGSDSSLTLGAVRDGTTYLAYPTVGGGATGTATFNLHGEVDFRSGIELAAGVTDLALNVDGETRNRGNFQDDDDDRIVFSGNLAGTKPVDVFSSANIVGGGIEIRQSHALVSSTVVDPNGRLAFAPVSGSDISYAGTITVDPNAGITFRPRGANAENTMSVTLDTTSVDGTVQVSGRGGRTDGDPDPDVTDWVVDYAADSVVDLGSQVINSPAGTGKIVLNSDTYDPDTNDYPIYGGKFATNDGDEAWVTSTLKLGGFTGMELVKIEAGSSLIFQSVDSDTQAIDMDPNGYVELNGNALKVYGADPNARVATEADLLVEILDGDLTDAALEVASPPTNKAVGITDKANDAGGAHVLVALTFKGDANVDQAVDVGDLGILAGNWGTTEGATWDQADFTGDGAVDVGDLGILAGNWGASAGVPEPATLALLSLGALALVRRRR